MNLQIAPEPLLRQASRVGLVDCDIHTKSSLEDMRPFLTERWWSYLQRYGSRVHHGYARNFPYPKSAPMAARRDSWPPSGGQPASDLEFLRAQLLDPLGIELAIMNPLSPTGQGELNPDLSAAMAFAANEVQLERWTRREPRLRASIVVPYEDGTASAEEIRRRGGDASFAHVLLMSRTSNPLGKRQYWPIYEAAQETGRPVGIHVFGYSGYALTNSGWPSFYIEEMAEHSVSCQAQVTSLVMEGVFERYRDLKIVLIEAGFGWLPALGWRLDRLWERMRDEVPHVKRPPSEYIRKHVWVTTQPMEEAERIDHVVDAMRWVGWDRILFATDYPHWDFDDPRVALPRTLNDEQRADILSGNARRVYGFV